MGNAHVCTVWCDSTITPAHKAHNVEDAGERNNNVGVAGVWSFVDAPHNQLMRKPQLFPMHRFTTGLVRKVLGATLCD